MGACLGSFTGILVASSPSELTPETRQVFSEEISGVRHRWIETFVPGLGWVPSDPGGLANTVTARHLALPGAPPRDFGLRVLARSPERTLPRLVTQGGLAAGGRPRQAPEIPRVELAPFGEPPR